MRAIREGIHHDERDEEYGHDIAHNEAVVAVRLAFAQLIKVIPGAEPLVEAARFVGHAEACAGRTQKAGAGRRTGTGAGGALMASAHE